MSMYMSLHIGIKLSPTLKTQTVDHYVIKSCKIRLFMLLLCFILHIYLFLINAVCRQHLFLALVRLSSAISFIILLPEIYWVFQINTVNCWESLCINCGYGQENYALLSLWISTHVPVTLLIFPLNILQLAIEWGRLQLRFQCKNILDFWKHYMIVQASNSWFFQMRQCK